MVKMISGAQKGVIFFMPSPFESFRLSENDLSNVKQNEKLWNGKFYGVFSLADASGRQ